MTCTRVWFVFAFFVVSIQAISLLGVPPAEILLYASGEIFCPGTDIRGKVNDDYCDCPDGKDEPGTSACSNGRFYCLNSGYIPHYIPSSRVRDGICDCCDSSDEAAGKCVNDCSKKAAELNAATEKLIAEHEAGLKLQEQFRQEYATTQASKQERQAELEAQKAEKDALIAALEVKAADIQTKMDEESERLKSELQPIVDAEVEMRVAEFLSRRESEVAEQQRQQEEQQQQEVVNTEPADGQGGSAEAPAAEPPTAAPAVDILAEAQGERERLSSEVMQAKINEKESYNALVQEKKSVEETELRGARDELHTITTELSEIKAWFDCDFGPGAQYAYMHSQTYIYTHPEYEYKVTPFKDAKQGWTSIGEWKGWEEGYGVMKFEGGTRCWGGPDRSLEVVLSCGAETVITEIKEPAKCEYSMKLKTPGACTAQELQNLKAKLFK